MELEAFETYTRRARRAKRANGGSITPMRVTDVAKAHVELAD